MNQQEKYVINSLSGLPVDMVVAVMYQLPALIKAVDESGWVEINEDNPPPANQLVRVWNATFEQEMIAKHIPKFSICTDDAYFEGDTEYNPADEKDYHPVGWYVFCEHVTLSYVYGLCLDNITHFHLLEKPDFVKRAEQLEKAALQKNEDAQ